MFVMNWQIHVLIVLSLWSLVGISPTKGNGNGSIGHSNNNARELQQKEDEHHHDHHHHNRELQECTLIPSGQKHEVIGTWVFDFVGRPGIIKAEEIEILKEILMEFNCQNQNDNSFFAFQYIQAMNMQYDDESMTYQNDTIPFSWMIRMHVSTNVLSQDEPGGIFDTRRLKEIPKEETTEGNNGLRRHLSSCRCVIPSRVDILMTTREMITELRELIPSIDTLSDIVRTEEVECSAGNDQFESFFSMTIYGDETSVTTQGLESVGNVFRSTYNVINLDACDMYFRKIANITVSVADTGIPTTNTNPGIPATENNDANGDNGPGRYLQIALPPAAAPAAASAGGSGSVPPAAAAPSDVTTFPTTSPTSRGPNLFTLLFTLSGTCRGCPSDQALFDQVDVPETPVGALSGSGARNRELDGFDNNGMGQCFCPVDAPLRGPTMDEFLGSLNPNLDVAKETGNVPFIETGGAIDLDGLQTFNCSVDYETFTRYLSASFTGDPSLLTEEDRRELERILMDAYNRLNEQFCDVDFKFVVRVRILDVVDTIPTASPSVIPTVSLAPSESGAPSHSLEPSIMPSGISNNNRRRQELAPVLEISRRELQEEDGEPSDSPTVSAAPSSSSHPSSSSSPSESPTEEVTASPFSFSVVFLLEGVCYGCENNAGLFNQVAGGRTRRQLNDESLSTTTNTQIHTDDGVCYCREDAVIGQVEQQAFFEEVEREIRVLDIQAIDSIVGATEMDEYDQTATGLAATIGSLVPSAVPSEFPSVFPSELPSVFPSELPSNMPSVSPSSIPSVNPSDQPTSAPSLSVVPTSYPSESPTGRPTKCRIIDDVPQTERYFVCTNEKKDDVQYPVCINNEGVQIESCGTANRNLEENGGVQRRAQEATGEIYECRVFVSVFDSEGCQRDYDPTEEFEVSGIISGVDRPCVATVTRADGLRFYVFPDCVLKTESPSLSPSNVPSSLPSENPTAAPSTSPSMDPTAQPSAVPTAVPSLSTFPTLAPSVLPSVLPSSTPSEGPTGDPSQSPSKSPSQQPTDEPTNDPTMSPKPTPAPTPEPTKSPTAPPTSKPTASPTLPPTSPPTTPPTLGPTPVPTTQPSSSPTTPPTSSPTKSPTQQPTDEPTNDPTMSPKPTPAPTPEPTRSPTAPPTSKPTASPTLPPTSPPTTPPTPSPPTTPPTPGPTPVPTTQPSSSPTTPPTSSPTPLPTTHPTQTPTTSPTTPPTPLPTTEPTPDPTPKPTITPEPTPDPTPGPTSSPTTTPTAEPTPAPTTSEPTSEPTPGPTPAPTQPPTPDPTPPPSPGPTPEPTTSAPTTVCSQAPPLSSAIFTCKDSCEEAKNQCEISLDNGEISCDNAGPGKGGNSPKQATCELTVTVHVDGVEKECYLYTESFTLVVPSNARNCDLCPPKIVEESGEPWYYVSGATCSLTNSGPNGSEINA